MIDISRLLDLSTDSIVESSDGESNTVKTLDRV